MRVGFAGLGIMGRGMAKNLATKGHAVRVWNRTASRVADLGRGIDGAPTPKALAEGADVVICCVSDPAAVERVVFAADGVLAGAKPGLRYVECSTVAPELVRRVARGFEALGCGMIEAPMTGSKLGAERGTLLFMAGGPAALVSELEPVLLTMGSRVIHCGPVGHGALMKLIGNAMISFMLEGLCEGLVVAEKGGLSVQTVLDVVAASGFASPYYAFKGDAVVRRDFEQHFSIDLLVKDQSLMLAEAAAQLTPLPGLAAIREVFQAARAQGLGQEDIVAVLKALERMAGVAPSGA
jgi:3-hydroxyisobutyrate dehydrogenase